MPSSSPADDIVQAREDVERIARAFYDADDEDMRAAHAGLAEALPAPPWDELPDDLKEHVRRTIKILLEREVIRVGKRPGAGPPPMKGQTTIEGGER